MALTSSPFHCFDLKDCKKNATTKTMIIPQRENIILFIKLYYFSFVEYTIESRLSFDVKSTSIFNYNFAAHKKIGLFSESSLLWLENRNSACGNADSLIC